ncbi:Hydantoin racemase [Nostocoides japonicum T1-X7]|uniref:Hydantoin racemase n=1 Tax=Nostocoides japonicum T1-X7 TaxID=1194083 RepID=A0A077LZS2_9MICO|nr:aspartate/glutamate racemase family protein [Tetrasphaera japonica]CCH77475.1 Hydantoin racemase [Tetrasphaera japonica T1-X7]
MGRRILWINPVMSDAYDEVIGASLRAEARLDTRLDVASLHGEGPVHLEYNAYELTAARPTLETVLWAEQEGYDATVIGCFYDPFVRAAKELTTRMPVTAPAEASIRLAQSVGERFSILVGRDKWIPEMEENVHRYGAERSLASFRVLGMGVNDFQVDPQYTESRIRAEAESAVATDRADVVILGCTIEFGFYRRLQAEIGVPIIDATVAPLLWAELLADAAVHQSWVHSSRLGYGTPEPAELAFVLQPVKPQLSGDPR